MKLKLTISGKQVELTVEEAKRLHAELSKAFSIAPIIVDRIVEKTVPIPYPVYPYQPPTFIDPFRPFYGAPEITCLSPSSAVA